MKILRQERHIVCFIEFEVSNLIQCIDPLVIFLLQFHISNVLLFASYLLMQDVNSATNVHHSLQGAVIPSSGSVGMRIQYPFNLLLCHLMYSFFYFY
jgi:hypothetical protein